MTTEEAVRIIAEITMSRAPHKTEDDLGTILSDSLDFIWAVNQIEERIGAEIPNEEIARARTVGDMAALMVAHAA